MGVGMGSYNSGGWVRLGDGSYYSPDLILPRQGPGAGSCCYLILIGVGLIFYITKLQVDPPIRLLLCTSKGSFFSISSVIVFTIVPLLFSSIYLITLNP